MVQNKKKPLLGVFSCKTKKDTNKGEQSHKRLNAHKVELVKNRYTQCDYLAQRKHK